MVESTDCIFDRPHHIRIGSFSDVVQEYSYGGGRLPSRCVLPCVLPKSQLLAIRTYSAIPSSARKLFESQYIDDTDKVPWEGFHEKTPAA